MPMLNTPRLDRVLKHIAYDNGMVNVVHTEEEAVAEMRANLIRRYRFEELICLDAALNGLSEEQLHEIAANTEEGYGLIWKTEFPQYHDMLDVAFDG